MNELSIRGKVVYLPPDSLRDVKGEKVFIPKEKEGRVWPLKESVVKINLSQNPEGIFLIPPRLNLSNLYEDELGKNFVGEDLDYVKIHLPSLFIDGLEIAEDLVFSIEGSRVNVTIEGSIYKDLLKEISKIENIYSSLGCPLTSSIALVIARSTGNPVIIEDITMSEDYSTIEVQYLMINV